MKDVAMSAEILATLTTVLIRNCPPTQSISRLKCQLVFAKRLIHVAIQPLFARLRGSDHRMPRGARVLRRVPVRRTVTTECDSAFLTCPQMHPFVTRFHALCAFASLRMFHRANLVKMGATSASHVYSDFCCPFSVAFRREANLI